MQNEKRIRHAKKMRAAGLLLTMLLILGGCTRKEELLLSVGEKSSEEAGEDVSLEGAGEAVKDGEGPSFEESVPDGQEESQPRESGLVYVHVCGAVNCPGVYELQAGSRVYEAVQMAGGFAAGADQNYVNQAQPLSDGTKLVIPTLEEAAAVRDSGLSPAAPQEEGGGVAQIGIVGGDPSAGQENADSAQAGDGRVNINTASREQLCSIPGIGATRAEAVIAYRESHGAFDKPEDIMKVNGIKEGMYEKIKDSISVN